jgi:predicted dehydrogenase
LRIFCGAKGDRGNPFNHFQGSAVNQRSIRRVALIGCDEQVLALIERGIAGGQVAIAAAVDAEAFAERLRQLAPETRFVSEWESILDGETVDVVIFAEPTAPFLDLPERRVEQLKKAAGAGLDLVLFHPACDGLLGYELEMARSTNRRRIITACPEAEHPIFRMLANRIANGDLRKIDQVIVDRAGLAADRQSILTIFVKDATLLRTLFGTPSKLNANGPSPESENWSNLAVLLTTADGPKIRWNLDPTESFHGLRMTIIAANGRALVTLDADGVEGKLTIGERGEQANTNSDWAYEIWAKLAAPREEEFAEEDPVWLAACRDLDLAAALQRSIARGRVVELKVDRATEAANFKGVMSAWGCLLLLGALLFFCIWSVVGALELTWTNGASEAAPTTLSDPTKVRLFSNLSWRYLPMFFLAVALLGFLGLQFLQLLIKPQRKAASEESPPTPQ